jgi:hypothetical protein
MLIKVEKMQSIGKKQIKSIALKTVICNPNNLEQHYKIDDISESTSLL